MSRILARKCALALAVVALLAPAGWLSLHGRWESAYTVRTPHGMRSYLLDIPNHALWNTPAYPTVAAFSAAFPDTETPFPVNGTVTGYHKWDWWLIDLLTVWLVSFAFIVLVGLSFSFKTPAWGALMRVGGGLYLGAGVCVVLWIIMGGWGPPAPLICGVAGIIAGIGWAMQHIRAHDGAETGPVSHPGNDITA